MASTNQPQFDTPPSAEGILTMEKWDEIFDTVEDVDGKQWIVYDYDYDYYYDYYDYYYYSYSYSYYSYSY